MKSFKIKLIAAISTLILGIFAVGVWFNILKVDDSTIYSVNLCDLIKNPDHYDGKIVRLKAFYLQGVERLNLSEDNCGREQLRAFYPSGEGNPKILQQISKIRRPKERARVDLIGRFTAEVLDTNPPQPHENPYIKILEIHEVIEVEAVKF